MAQLFIITANYGQFEDYREVELFATVNPVEAYAEFAALQVKFVGAFDEMIERMPHNGSLDYGSFLAAEPIVEVVDAAWHDEGFSLSLYEMILGQLTKGKNRLETKYISFTPDADFVSSEEGSESAYETLAAPYEAKW